MTRPCRVFGRADQHRRGHVAAAALGLEQVADGGGVKASAPMPYTVSVGSTTSSPRLIAEVASRSPARGRSRRSSRTPCHRALPRWKRAAAAGRCVCRVRSRGAVHAHCLAGRDEARPVGQIAVVGRVGPAGSSREDPRHRPPCASACSTTTSPPGRSSRRAARSTTADGVEPVRARRTGPARGRGRAPRGRRGPARSSGMYGGLLIDQVDRAVEVGQRVERVAGCRSTRGPARCARPSGARLVSSTACTPARHLLGDRERDRPGAGAQVHHQRLGHVHRAHASIAQPADRPRSPAAARTPRPDLRARGSGRRPGR